MRGITTPSSLSPVSAAGGALQTLAVRYHGMRDHSYHIMMQNAYAYAESSTWAWEDPREPLAQQGPTGGCTVEPSEPPDKMSWKMHPPCDAAAYAQPPRGGLPLNPRAPTSSRCSGVRTPLHAVFQHSPGPLCAGATAALIHTGPQHTAFQRTGDRSAQLRSSHCRSTQRSSGQRTAALSSEARIAAAHSVPAGSGPQRSAPKLASPQHTELQQQHIIHLCGGQSVCVVGRGRHTTSTRVPRCGVC